MCIYVYSSPVKINKKKKSGLGMSHLLGYSGAWVIVESDGKAHDHTTALLKEDSIRQQC